MKEKAKDLVNKYRKIMPGYTDESRIKRCALICVEQMKEVETQILQGVPTDFVYCYKPDLDDVKQEIEKL